MSNKKIVLVGGHCGGKTTTVPKLINKLKNNYLILSTEEIAGALLGLGYLDEYILSTANIVTKIIETVITTLVFIFLIRLSSIGASAYTAAIPPRPNTSNPSAHILPFKFKKYPE